MPIEDDWLASDKIHRKRGFFNFTDVPAKYYFLKNRFPLDVNRIKLPQLRSCAKCFHERYQKSNWDSNVFCNQYVSVPAAVFISLPKPSVKIWFTDRLEIMKKKTKTEKGKQVNSSITKPNHCSSFILMIYHEKWSFPFVLFVMLQGFSILGFSLLF